MTLTLLKMGAVLGELSLLMLSLLAVHRSGRLHPELVRKLLHIAMGLTVLTFPWLFEEAWPVLVLSAASLFGLSAVRVVPALRERLGGVISGVERVSHGELYYPLAVGLLWWLSGGDPLLFGVPILVLTLGDAMAALIGLRYGRLRYQTHDGWKSAEGSIAFFAIAFLSVHLPVLLSGTTGRTEAVLLGVIVGLLVMLLESIAWRGLDNLFIPLGTFGFLNLYLEVPAEALAWRCGVAVILVFFTLLWRRRSTLDDAALIGASLFGYAALLLGGWVWVLPPLAVFVGHHLMWCRGERGERRRVHSVGAILSIIGVGMVCLLLQTQRPWAGWLWAYTAGFTAHLTIIAVSYRPSESMPRRGKDGAWLLYISAVAWAVTALPVALLSIPEVSLPLALLLAGSIYLMTALAGLIFQQRIAWLYRPDHPTRRVTLTAAGLASVCAVVLAIVCGFLAP